MLNDKQISELREHLERAQNPLFFYDNDADGLCSFLILRRFLDRGSGVAIRSYPDLNASYARKATELKADYVFVLDKPVVSPDFFEELAEKNIPLVWIDHHNVSLPIDPAKFSNLQIYNPAREKNGDEPVTALVYELTKRKEDLWLAVIGCIADHYMPKFAESFAKQYPELWGKNIEKPFDVYYNTDLGKIARSFNFGLKDSASNIVQLQKFLISCKSPADVLSEAKDNGSFRKKLKEVQKKYDSLLGKALTQINGKMLFFEYRGDLSISADLSNELKYRHPEVLVAVAYIKGTFSNVSIRSNNAKSILEKILPNFAGATGGGHEKAVGARVKTEDLKRFKELLEAELKKSS